MSVKIVDDEKLSFSGRRRQIQAVGWIKIFQSQLNINQRNAQLTHHKANSIGILFSVLC
jgi:hypothetical protein